MKCRKDHIMAICIIMAADTEVLVSAVFFGLMNNDMLARFGLSKVVKMASKCKK